MSPVMTMRCLSCSWNIALSFEQIGGFGTVGLEEQTRTVTKDRSKTKENLSIQDMLESSTQSTECEYGDEMSQ